MLVLRSTKKLWNNNSGLMRRGGWCEPNQPTAVVVVVVVVVCNCRFAWRWRGCEAASWGFAGEWYKMQARVWRSREGWRLCVRRRESTQGIETLP